MDPLLPLLAMVAGTVLLLGALARRVGQPHPVTYLVAGVLLGRHGLGVLEDAVTVGRLGEIGVLLLLFFAGMEVDVHKLVRGWRISVVGTLLQVAVSVGVVALIGLPLDWPLARIVLIGFAISLSSTALVLSVLGQWKELHTPAGGDALGILLVQDVLVVPMLIVLGLLGGGHTEGALVARQIGGSVLLAGVLVVLLRRKGGAFPLPKALAEDHELQVFAAFATCFGCAWLTALLGLSTALGAFFAGLVIGASRQTAWVHHRLEPFRVLFVATFFASVGLLLDLDFVFERPVIIGLLVIATIGTNTVLNAFILRFLGRSWRTSLYVGALLSQAGEFSFVLAAVGAQSGIISNYAYQGVIAVIAGTLVLSPLWIMVWRPYRGPSARAEV